MCRLSHQNSLHCFNIQVPSNMRRCQHTQRCCKKYEKYNWKSEKDTFYRWTYDLKNITSFWTIHFSSATATILLNTMFIYIPLFPSAFKNQLVFSYLTSCNSYKSFLSCNRYLNQTYRLLFFKKNWKISHKWDILRCTSMGLKYKYYRNHFSLTIKSYNLKLEGFQWWWALFSGLEQGFFLEKQFFQV